MNSLLLDFEDVARLIRFSPATVANWAYRRKPAPQGFPQTVKVGRMLRYRLSDIEGWIAGLGAVELSVSGTDSDLTNDSLRTRRSRGRPRLA